MAALTVVLFLASTLMTVVCDNDCKYCLGKTPYFTHEKRLPVEDYVKKFGYPMESHEIQTEDGYLLTYHRIPQGLDPNAPLGRPVLVQHGLFGSSSSWVMSEDSLAFTLADAGFDVWLANCRGNTYSRKHIKYDPDKDKKAFWDFSWHEIGYYDMPAAIDYILQETGEDNLLFIGHSMGTTAYFVMGSTRPEYMKKIQAAVVMAPIVYPWHVRGQMYKILYAITDTVSVLVDASGMYEIFPYTNAAAWMDQNVCPKSQLEFICADIIEGFGFYQTGMERVELDKVLEYNPAGASYKQLHHFKQISQEGHPFQQFDYGYVQNLMKYGSIYAPVYDVSRVTVPLYVYYANNDMKSVPEDVYYLVDKLPNVERVTEVQDDKFNHLDFMWAKYAKELVYNDIVSTFKGLPKNTSPNYNVPIHREH